MNIRIVDLSVALDNDLPSDPPFSRPQIDYFDHDQTLDRMQKFFPALQAEELPDSAAWAMEKVNLTTHNGTHLDAPYHYHPTMNHEVTPGGEPSATIDQIPLEWCFRPGVKLDLRHFPDGYVATEKDVQDELARIGHELSPLEIVLINTSAGERFGDNDYTEAGCGVGREATLSLLRRGIRVTGTDAWSWDAPFSYTKKKVDETGEASLIWEGHKAGREIGYCHIEKLHNLEVLPPTGFYVSCLPVKISRASAGWTRAAAIFMS